MADSGNRKASLPSWILICSSQTLATLRWRSFAGSRQAARARLDERFLSLSHQMKLWVSSSNLMRPCQARTRPAAGRRNRRRLPRHPRAYPLRERSGWCCRRYLARIEIARRGSKLRAFFGGKARQFRENLLCTHEVKSNRRRRVDRQGNVVNRPFVRTCHHPVTVEALVALKTALANPGFRSLPRRR